MGYFCWWVCHRRAAKQGVASKWQCVDLTRAVQLGYQPTLCPGGTQTSPKGVLFPSYPLTPRMTVHVYTFVCKRDAGVQG